MQQYTRIQKRRYNVQQYEGVRVRQPLVLSSSSPLLKHTLAAPHVLHLPGRRCSTNTTLPLYFNTILWRCILLCFSSLVDLFVYFLEHVCTACPVYICQIVDTFSLCVLTLQYRLLASFSSCIDVSIYSPYRLSTVICLSFIRHGQPPTPAVTGPSWSIDDDRESLIP